MPHALPRRLLALAAAGLALPAQAQGIALPAGGYRFRMLRGEREIGSHVVTFARSGEQLTVGSTVSILVRVMGFTVFEFSHAQQELWQGDRLLRASAREQRNGTVEEMAAEASGGALLVRGSAGEFRLPPEAAPSAWWDARRPGRPLFDGANGKPLTVAWSRAARPDGGVAWTATGDMRGTAGYAADGTWQSQSLVGNDGSTVVYAPA